MIESVQGSLTLINVNLPNPEVYWKGAKVLGVVSIRVDCDESEQRVKLKVAGTAEAVCAELVSAGVIIKRVAA